MIQREDWLGASKVKRLGAALKALRVDAGLSGTQLANRLGWHQTKVSRYERGGRVPTEDEVRAWVQEVGGDRDTADNAVALLADAQETRTQWRTRLAQSQAAHQVDFDEVGRRATFVQNLCTAVMPGLLQTADYAHWKFLENAVAYGVQDQDVSKAVAARMQRQGILYDGQKKFRFLMTETPMRMYPCPDEVMIGQLDRLLAIIGMSNVQLGIIPAGQRRIIPQHAFSAYDDVIFIETHVNEYTILGEDADAFLRVMDLLAEEAVFGETARQLILDAIAAIRRPTV